MATAGVAASSHFSGPRLPTSLRLCHSPRRRGGNQKQCRPFGNYPTAGLPRAAVVYFFRMVVIVRLSPRAVNTLIGRVDPGVAPPVGVCAVGSSGIILTLTSYAVFAEPEMLEIDSSAVVGLVWTIPELVQFVSEQPAVRSIL